MRNTARTIISVMLCNHCEHIIGFIRVAGGCVCLSASVCTWTHAFLDSVSKVEGNISGKSLRKTGRRNSMKGTMINTMKGTRRNRSAQVLISCKHGEDKCWRYKLDGDTACGCHDSENVCERGGGRGGCWGRISITRALRLCWYLSKIA